MSVCPGMEVIGKLTVGFLSANHSEQDKGTRLHLHAPHTPLTLTYILESSLRPSLRGIGPLRRSRCSCALSATIMKMATASSTFMGADLLLTTEWGQGVAAGYDLSKL